jgi:hypothetical protein
LGFLERVFQEDPIRESGLLAGEAYPDSHRTPGFRRKILLSVFRIAPVGIPPSAEKRDASERG